MLNELLWMLTRMDMVHLEVKMALAYINGRDCLLISKIT